MRMHLLGYGLGLQVHLLLQEILTQAYRLFIYLPVFDVYDTSVFFAGSAYTV